MKRHENEILWSVSFFMKTTRPLIIALFLALACGCSDKSKEAEKVKQDADAKARADAAKKEMDTVPKVFSTPDYFKKNQPTPAPDTAPVSSNQGTKS
jgi:hypothetical protein